MMNQVGRFFAVLRKREIIDMDNIRDDIRKLGLVLAGGGFLAIALNGNWLGFVAVIVGFILLFFGLTQPKQERSSKDESDG